MLVFFLKNHDHVNQKSRNYDLLFALNLEKQQQQQKRQTNNNDNNNTPH